MKLINNESLIKRIFVYVCIQRTIREQFDSWIHSIESNQIYSVTGKLIIDYTTLDAKSRRLDSMCMQYCNKHPIATLLHATICDDRSKSIFTITIQSYKQTISIFICSQSLSLCVFILKILSWLYTLVYLLYISYK